MAIECLVLGAGQTVGKSCVVATVGGKRIMFDCGMHMGYADARSFPDFSLIPDAGEAGFDSAISCVIITHFHLDHIGALPYFTEVCGYSGPIYMTYPTKALAPLMLEDYRKVKEQRGDEEKFTVDHITKCMDKVITVDIKQTVQVDKDIQICAYYAGHNLVLCVEEGAGGGCFLSAAGKFTNRLRSVNFQVLGAAMFYVKVGDATMVYTGDYNMTPDRHLGAAQINHLHLDLLITESTYATTVRDSKYAREREFLKVVHKCVSGGGKVLIPAFALGRAQELCILLDDYWERMNLKIPIYFSAGLTIQANMYYKTFIGWTSQKIKDSSAIKNAFDFKHVYPFKPSMINDPGPCVLFATPGMLTGGFSVEVFKHWAPSEKNLVTLPGYCLAGTLGHKLMSGKATTVDLDQDTRIEVRCQIHQLSFSPHTDAKGIMDLVGFLSPKHVILVHGEKPKMATLKAKIESDLGIQSWFPANGETVHVPTSQSLTIHASKAFIRSQTNSNFKTLVDFSTNGETLVEGILMMEKTKKAKALHKNEFLGSLSIKENKVHFAYCCPVNKKKLTEIGDTWLESLFLKLKERVDFGTVEMGSDHLSIGSFRVYPCLKESCCHRVVEPVDLEEPRVYFCCSWSTEDEKLAWRVLSIARDL